MSGRVLSDSPRVVLIPKFLSDHELNHFLNVAEGKFKESTVIDNSTGENVKDPHRTGDLAMLEAKHDSVIQSIEERVASVTGTRPPQGEPFQVIRYGKGQTYKPHHDYFFNGVPGHDQPRKSGGQRIKSFIIYLKCADEGGRTKFPELNIEVDPQPGDALVFTNVLEDGQPDPRTLHEGAPVVSGEKIIASRWIRERAFDGSEEPEFLARQKAEEAAAVDEERKASEAFQKRMTELRNERERRCYEKIKPILAEFRCGLVSVVEPVIDPQTGVLRFNSAVEVRAR